MKCKRLLIPPGIALMVLPFCIIRMQQVAWIALSYFMGSFFLLVNFPYFSIVLHSKPIYFEDLSINTENSIDNRFKTIYETIMIVFLSILIAVFADYIYLNGFNVPPLEFIGIIGGNISVYLRVQNIVGKGLLKCCFFFKKLEESKTDNAAT